jgi:nitrite reductase (NO-forming)
MNLLRKTKNKTLKKSFSFAFAFTVVMMSVVASVEPFANNSGRYADAQSISSSPHSPITSAGIGGNSDNSSSSSQYAPALQIQQSQQQQPQQPPRTHEYTLIAENTTLEISPGLRVDAWTYNGTMPGPTLTATEGDRVIVHFINKTPLPHTVHMHGDHPSEQDGVFEIIGANGTYTYDFIATPAGALMYHCHVPPVMQHVRMGLYGAFIVYPKTPLPPAREYVLVDGEYDTQNQLNPLPEYYFFNGYTEQYHLHPLPAATNETVRIYLINAGLSPAYGMHIHGTLFKAYPSGIWQNPPLRVQSWELASGNTAILEAKWPWPGRFTFHFHGIPEERGAMGYFNVTNSPANAVDGKDVAISKSIWMDGWQTNLTKSLQEQDPYGNVTATESLHGNTEKIESRGIEGHDMHEGNGIEKSTSAAASSKSASNNSTDVTIVKGATTLGDKSYSPNPIKIKVGNVVTWRNHDSIIHTVTSGAPNSPEAGEAFDSGLTSLIMPSKEYSHKFTNAGEFSYFCRIHPKMEGKIVVVP